MKRPPQPGRRPDLTPLVELVTLLRRPDGCPWDRQLTLLELRAYLLEEAHEVVAAIDHVLEQPTGEGSKTAEWKALEEEVGDLLFQVSYLATLGHESKTLELDRAIRSVHDKMVDRHPHVFGDRQDSAIDAEEVARAWQRHKAVKGDKGLLDGIPPTLPALVAAYRMGQKAAGLGFDWTDAAEVLVKVDEELDELRSLTLDDSTETRERLEEELGDVLFSIASLARHLDLDPEAALAKGNAKFRRRFAHVEKELSLASPFDDDERRERLEQLWQQAKEKEL